MAECLTCRLQGIQKNRHEICRAMTMNAADVERVADFPGEHVKAWEIRGSSRRRRQLGWSLQQRQALG